MAPRHAAMRTPQERMAAVMRRSRDGIIRCRNCQRAILGEGLSPDSFYFPETMDAIFCDEGCYKSWRNMAGYIP